MQDHDCALQGLFVALALLGLIFCPTPHKFEKSWKHPLPSLRIYNIVTTTHPPLISLALKKVDNLFSVKEPA